MVGTEQSVDVDSNSAMSTIKAPEISNSESQKVIRR